MALDSRESEKADSNSVNNIAENNSFVALHSHLHRSLKISQERILVKRLWSMVSVDN